MFASSIELRPDSGIGRTSGRALVVVLIGLFVLASALVVSAVKRAPGLSYYDEWTHADYAYQIAHGHIPARGSLLAPQIAREWSCHRGPGSYVTPACGSDAAVSSYPLGGENYNFGHPPLYYAITGILARAIDAIIPGEQFITIARTLGLLWLYAAMLVLYAAIRRFGAGRRLAGLGAAGLALWPVVLHASSTVTNDAAAPLAGSLSLWVLARILVEHKTGWFLPTAVTIAITSTKVLNGFPMLCVAAVTAVLGIAMMRQRDRTWRDFMWITIGIVVGVLVVLEGWHLFQSGRGAAHWTSPVQGINTRPIVGLPIQELFGTMFTGFQITSGYYLQPQIDGFLIHMWAQVLTVLIGVLPVMAITAFRRGRPEWILGVGTLFGIIAFPIVVQLETIVTAHGYFPTVNGRYGMTMIPWLMVCAAVVAAKHERPWTIAAITGAGTVATLVTVGGLLS